MREAEHRVVSDLSNLFVFLISIPGKDQSVKHAFQMSNSLAETYYELPFQYLSQLRHYQDALSPLRLPETLMPGCLKKIQLSLMNRYRALHKSGIITDLVL